MKQSVFLVLVLCVTLVVAFGIWWFILGNPANFADGDTRHQPLKGNLLGTIFTGGYIVPILITLTLMNLTIVFERVFSLRKAQGKGSLTAFLKKVQAALMGGKVDDAMKECDSQRVSAENIIRAVL